MEPLVRCHLYMVFYSVLLLSENTSPMCKTMINEAGSPLCVTHFTNVAEDSTKIILAIITAEPFLAIFRFLEMQELYQSVFISIIVQYTSLLPPSVKLYKVVFVVEEALGLISEDESNKKTVLFFAMGLYYMILFIMKIGTYVIGWYRERVKRKAGMKVLRKPPSVEVQGVTPVAVVRATNELARNCCRKVGGSLPLHFMKSITENNMANHRKEQQKNK